MSAETPPETGRYPTREYHETRSEPGRYPTREYHETRTSNEVDVKTWGIFAHLSLLTYLLGGVLAFLGPLVVWMVGKDKSPVIDEHGKAALNFGITVSILALILWVAVPVVTIGLGALVGPIGAVLGLLVTLLWIGLFVFWLIFMILGTVAASKENVYHYPASFHFVK